MRRLISIQLCGGLLLASGCGSGTGSFEVVAPTAFAFPVSSAVYAACEIIDPNVPAINAVISEWTVSPPLPNGLSIDQDTGAISGTALSIQPEVSYLITATNAGGSIQTTITIEVGNPDPIENLSYPVTDITYELNVPIEPLVPTVDGNVNDWFISPNLPAGLDIDEDTGVIAGTPTAASPATAYTVLARNCFGQIDQFTITISVFDPDSANSTRFLLACHEGDDTVSSLRVDALTGKASHLSYQVTGSQPVALAATPEAGFVYTLNRGSADITALALDSATGELTEIAGSPFPVTGGGQPSDLALSPDGAFLASSDSVLGEIQVFAVAGDGTLSEIAGSPFTTDSGSPSELLYSPTGDLLFAIHNSASRVASYPIAGDGSLVEELSLLTPDAPQCLAQLENADGDLVVYVGSGGSSNAVTPYVIGPAGGFNPLSSITTVNGSIVALEAVQLFGATSSSRILYALNDTLDRVQRLGILNSGQATIPLDSAPFYGGVDPVALKLSNDDAFLFTAFQGDGELSVASIDPEDVGLATPISPSSSPTDRVRLRNTPSDLAVVTGGGPLVLVTDRAYAANFLDDDIAQFSAAGAELTALTPATVGTGAGPNDLVTHPTLDVVYLVNTNDGAGGQDLQVFDVNVDGTLIEPPTDIDLGAVASAPTGAWSVEIDRAGRNLILIRADSTSELISFPIDAAGQLGTATTATAGDTARGAAIDPTGQFVYVTNSVEGTVDGFRIDPLTGALTSVGPASAAGVGPWDAAIDDTGRFLYVANRGSDDISAYSISATDGTLTAIPAAGGGGATTDVGLDPSGLAVHPGSRLLYVVNEGDDTITRALINLSSADSTTDGTLIFPIATDVGDGPRSLSFSGDGTVLGVGFSGDGQVRSYSVDVTSGGEPILFDTEASASGSGTRAVSFRVRRN